MWCWRRRLKVPWTSRRSNQSILKEISPGISLEGMMLKLKFQYAGRLMRRVDSLEKTLMLGGIGGRRRRGWQRVSWLDGVTDSVDMNLSKLWEIVKNRGAWHAAVHQVSKSQKQLSDWTTSTNKMVLIFKVYSVSQFSHSVMSNSLQPHGLQHAGSPCPSLTPGLYSNSCLLSQWCHPTISSSIFLFSSHLQPFPASVSFHMSQFFTSGGQSFGVSASASILSMNI